MKYIHIGPEGGGGQKKTLIQLNSEIILKKKSYTLRPTCTKIKFIRRHRKQVRLTGT